jgi:hypothetical protein
MNLVCPIPFYKNKNRRSVIWLSFLYFIFLSGCRKEIKLDLPVYEPKMVLEFYLEDDKSLHCLLQESIVFTDATQYKLIDSAFIVLMYDGQKDTLHNTIFFDPQFQKIYNYHNPKRIQLEANIDYEVYVRDRNGREMTGKTRLLDPIPIDSLVYSYNSDNQAAVGLLFTDFGDKENYYRIVAYKDSLVVNQDNVWDITFEDNLFNGSQFSFYTGYAFNPGDTVIGRLYHLTEEHNQFAESVNDAQASNGNPFAQPANILSNLTGGIGIFTTLSYTEVKLFIQ